MGILSKESNIPNIPINQPTSKSDVEKTTNNSQEVEVSSYLDKNKGKIGTIKTSWQGLLDKEKDKNQITRKTLLGE